MKVLKFTSVGPNDVEQVLRHIMDVALKNPTSGGFAMNQAINFIISQIQEENPIEHVEG